MLTVLSEQLGKISVWGRGLGGSKHPCRTATQVFCYSEFVINKKGDVYSLSSADLIRSFYNLSESVEKVSLANYFCQLCERAVYDSIYAPDGMKLLLNSLHYLECEDKEFYDLWLMFELKMLDVAGFMPNMHECVICGNEAALYVNISAGGLVCSNCPGGNIRISPKVYMLMKQYLSVNLKTALMMRENDINALREAIDISGRFISEYIGNLKCRSYLKNIVRM